MAKAFRPNAKHQVKAGDVVRGMVLPFGSFPSYALYVLETGLGEQKFHIQGTLNPDDPDDHDSRILIQISPSIMLSRFETVDET